MNLLFLDDDIGSDRPVQENDTLNTKKALKQVGHYETPDYGMTAYPDQRMFDGIKQFQKDQNLFPDGIMKPQGETIQALNRALGGAKHSPRTRGIGTPANHGNDPGRDAQLKRLQDIEDAINRQLTTIQRQLRNAKTPDEVRELQAQIKELEDRLDRVRHDRDRLWSH